MSVHESAKVAPSKMANKQDTELPKLSTVSEVVAESFDGALGGHFSFPKQQFVGQSVSWRSLSRSPSGTS